MASLLNIMIFLPAVMGIVCLFVPTARQAKLTALAASVLTMLLSIVLTIGYDFGAGGVQYVTAVQWIDGINVWYATGVDGLSLPLVLLTTMLSVLVVLASFSIEKNVKGFMALYLFLYTGMLGVFLALDLFLFYVFFEISLLPMYFLIGIWGGPRKEYAAIKFFIYTLVGSVCLLIVMLGFYFITPEAAGGSPTWDMMAMQGKASLTGEVSEAQGAAIARLFADGGKYFGYAQWFFWLTLIAFMIKLPAVPFHTWLPDAHVEAPTPISMILAGVLLKMGGYALMRITYPIFPDAGVVFWPWVAGLGVIAIIYGGFCAMAQTDWKKLVAYSSVSHMGYVTLGIAVLTRAGWDGAYFQMIGHGITSAMMFFMVGVVYERAHHRDLNRFGGLWIHWPQYGAWSLICFFAALGLPGMCGFIGEIMALLGTFHAAAPGAVGAEQQGLVYFYGIVAATGVILTAAYILWMFQRVYFGLPKPDYEHYPKPVGREYFIMATLGIASIVFGVIPMLIFNMTASTFDQLPIETVTAAADAAKTVVAGH